MERKNNLAKNTILLSLGTFLNKGLMFVMVPFFSRWLSSEDYGTFDVFTTYVSLLIPFITLASSNAVFRLSQDVDTDKGKKVYISNGAFIMIVNTVVATIILLLWKSFVGFDYFLPFWFLLVGEVFDNYFQGYLRAIKKLSIYAISKSVGTVLTSTLVTIFVYFMDLGLAGILYGYAFGYIVTDLFIAILTNLKKYFSLKYFSIKGIKELIGYSYALIPNDVSWWIINVSDRSIINFFLGAAANGVYAIACKVPNICSAVFGMFNISWQETATEMITDNQRNKYFQEIYRKMVSILISLCGGMLCCNFILFDFIFDVKYSDARYYAPILVTSIVFSSLSQYFGGIQISLKRPKENGVTTILGAVVNLVVHLALVKFVGLYAAALSTIVANIVVMFVRKVKLKKVVSVKLERIEYLYVLFYIYFFISCYIEINYVISSINLMIAIVLFIIINKDFLEKFLKRIRHN